MKCIAKTPAITAPSVDRADDLAADLRSFVEAPAFPCVGAKAALRRHQLEIVVASDIRSSCCDLLITRRLQEFAIRHDSDDSVFVSQAVIFENAPSLSEDVFETHLWQRLTALHVIDRQDFHWDPKVDSDPSSPHFSLSIGGKGFFVVGLHPNASRAARRFTYPTMVFNMHAQFERLREDGRYEPMRRKTIERDIALEGTANPMLARHGEGPVAAQFSGRRVGSDWKCPFPHD
jgi:FPC/CPF motif-containing protein YcgG